MQASELRLTVMKTVLTALLAATVLVPAASGAAALQPSGSAADKQPPILPGYWSYTARLYGVPQTKKRCIKAEEAEDFLTRPCNRHHTCVYPTKQVGNGKLLLDGYWQNKEGQRARVHASGVYEPKSFSIKANGSAIGGIPFLASMDAKWLSADCPPGA
jgi:hypothetical protein